MKLLDLVLVEVLIDHWIKKLTKPKSVQDIQVFLGFANFYQQFIQGFSKIATPLTSMLKTTVSLQVLVANEVLATDEVGGIEGGDELIKKCRKLSKTRKLSKSKNQRPTSTTEERNFFTSDTKTDFRFWSDFI